MVRRRKKYRQAILRAESLESKAMLAGDEWTIASGGNGHFYEFASGSLTWSAAKTAAESRGGYLATITSAAEQAFLQSKMPAARFWLGAYHDHDAPDFSPPDRGWRWVTGEPWDYTAWNPGEPNNTGTSFDAVHLEISGEWNDHSQVTPFNFIVEYALPGAPINVSGTAGNTQVSLSWTAPTSAGSSAITDYVVQYSSNSGSSWATFNDGTSTATSATVTGLTSGTGYIFRVAAVNSVGTGSYSANSGTVTPVSQHEWTIASGGNGHFYEFASGSLTWSAAKTAAESRGGYLATITSAAEQAFLQSKMPAARFWLGAYHDHDAPDFSPPDRGWRWVTGEPWDYTAWNPGEPNNTGTSFDAVHLEISGEWNDHSQVTPFNFIVEYALPGAPINVSGTAGNTQVSLSWTAPTSAGSSAITDYVVQYSSNSGSSWATFNDGTSTATSATVTGLTSGTGYIFRVAAVNSVGTGSYSANSGTVTPGTGVSFNVAANQTVTDTVLRTGSVQLVKQGLGVLVLTKANSHSGGTIIESGQVVIRNSAALGIGQLTVRAGATVTVDLKGAELSVGSLVIDDGGLIDVGNSRISIPAGGYSFGQVSDLLKKGYAANWAVVSGIGSGMARSAAGRSLGYFVDGGGSITLGFAAPGDSNFDGVFDILDIGDIISAGKFNTGAAANWRQGDVNYDNVFDIVDLADILGTNLFNQGTYLTQGSATSSAVETGGVATFDSALVFAALAMDSGGPTTTKRKSL